MKKNQKIFDLASDKNRDEIVKTCHNGDEDAFLKHCISHKCESLEEFQNAVVPVLMAGINTETEDWKHLRSMEKKLAHAAHEVSRGMHKWTWICWQCGERLLSTVKNARQQDIVVEVSMPWMSCGCCLSKRHSFHSAHTDEPFQIAKSNTGEGCTFISKQHEGD